MWNESINPSMTLYFVIVVFLIAHVIYHLFMILPLSFSSACHHISSLWYPVYYVKLDLTRDPLYGHFCFLSVPWTPKIALWSKILLSLPSIPCCSNPVISHCICTKKGFSPHLHSYLSWWLVVIPYNNLAMNMDTL